VSLMQADVILLEEKVQQLIALCASLRDDNRTLRQRLLAADRTNRKLSAQMNEAAQRLDALLSRLPAEGK
jgi:cell division protein ZapB